MRSRDLLLALLLALAASPRVATAAQGGLDLDGWLRRPGVKLVAVEFYARWCKPCMEAVPRWRALHQRYRDEGLRLVVVATQDPGSALENPGWDPDEIVADDSGAIARALGAADKLPSAFVWNWQGRLLAPRAHVDDVERSIEAWLKAMPRLDVEVDKVPPAAGIAAPALRDLVREEVRDEDKLQVVATEEERRALDRMKADSFKARFDDQMQCEVGKELPANSLLRARISGDDPARSQLSLLLLSAERGCLVAAASVPWSAKRAKTAVAEAVSAFMAKIRTGAEMPGALAERARPAESVPEPATRPVETPPPEPPKAELTRVVVTGSSIEIREQIHFATAGAKVAPASLPILDEVASVMRSNPSLGVAVECHSDNAGAHAALVGLTERRAAAVVELLVARSVPRDRLSAKGYGPDLPIATNASAVGRAQNRRCEFKVVK